MRRFLASKHVLPVVIGMLCLSSPRAVTTAQDAVVDLAKAVVVSPPSLSKSEKKAVEMLVEEVELRTGIRFPALQSWPADGAPVIALGPAAALNAFAGKHAAKLAAERLNGAEGYRIQVDQSGPAPAVFVIGNDPRGVLFGAGRLLREMRLTPGSVSLSSGLKVATVPKYSLRGHQLGYRPKTNSYDGWSLPMWEQYFRDLAVFGTNAIELIPPRSDDAADSPHFPLPPLRMMQGMSQLADDYGLDVWIWYPAMDRDYSDPKTVEFALGEWGEVFKNLPRIDAVFVPGGDPGHTQPKHLMALLEKQTQTLRRYHPRAEMWVSPQSFNQAWMEEFLQILKAQQPPWLAGVVFGPQTRMSLSQLRTAVPPEISHPALSRHHTQPAVAIPGSGLGSGLCDHPGPRRNQSAPRGASADFSPAPATHGWFSDLFRRMQRRCQQVHLERTRLGTRDPRSRCSQAV